MTIPIGQKISNFVKVELEASVPTIDFLDSILGLADKARRWDQFSFEKSRSGMVIGRYDPERGETNKIPRKDIACEGLLPCKVSGDWQELKEITSAPFYDRNITISVARDRESLAGLAEIPIRIDAFNLMNPPSTAHELARRYERDEDLVRFIKSVRGSRYQICGATFRKRDGGDYSEIHHLESLADGGLDVSRNMLVVCAHHHRQFHFGEISVIVRTKQKIEVEIDGQRHICALGSI
jgi:hypothetical protein